MKTPCSFSLLALALSSGMNPVCYTTSASEVLYLNFDEGSGTALTVVNSMVVGDSVGRASTSDPTGGFVTYQATAGFKSAAATYTADLAVPTDQPDHPPGSTAHISGVAFQPSV